MNDGSIRMLARLSGAGFFVLGTIGHFIYPGGAPDFVGDPAAIASFFNGHADSILASNLFFLIGGMLLLVFAAVLREELRGPDGDNVLAATVFGALIAGAAIMIASTGPEMVAALRVQQQGSIPPQLAATMRDLNMVLFGLSAPMALAVAVLGCGAAALRRQAFPLWLGVASIVLGVALAIPPINHVSIVIFTFWALAASVTLAVRPATEPGDDATAGAPAAATAP